MRILTGITTTGTPHLGNYVGAIKPCIEATINQPDCEHFFFLADLHGLVKCHEPERLCQSTLDIAATWLALGLDPDQCFFYRQSDIPEIGQLNWILSCVAAKGLLNRAHAYKAVVQNNIDENQDPDYAITMGLFSYPVLMAADILAFSGQTIPVGKDQIQHVEIARDIAQRFNHLFGDTLTLPQAQCDETTQLLKGLDGRKMSKSYDNTIALFGTEKNLRKQVNKIKTNLLEPGEAKDPNDSTVFEIWQAVASPKQTEAMRQAFADGIAWGEAKKQLFELLNGALGEARERYHELIARPKDIEDILQSGAQKARTVAGPLLASVQERVGIRALG